MMSNVTPPKGMAALLRQACDEFVATFGRRPIAAAGAPGRVNLIGDHVDYCEGLVLPMALPYVTVATGDFNSTDNCNVRSLLPSGEILVTQFGVQSLTPGPESWVNYIKGVISNFPASVNGFDMMIVSDVPIGAGLSSSASLELAVFTFLEALTKRDITALEKAKLCQKAEHEFAGMPCGIMDQYIGAMGREGYALLIDCKSLQSTPVALKDEDIVVLVINSNVKHQLTGSEYPERRAHCHRAAEILGLSSLREATTEHLEELKRSRCDEAILKRAKHVVGEIERTQRAAELISAGKFGMVGKIFYESHESLAELMQVSCPEIEEIVKAAKKAIGVLGARMTGGGFGGCVVALVQKEQLERAVETIKRTVNDMLAFYVCHPCYGAKALNCI